jgi:ribosome recycling factor
MNTEIQTKFRNAIAHLADQLKKVRTGRAHTDMLSSVMAEAYGALTPLNQMAQVSVTDAITIQITPFDPSNITAIAKAIRDDQNLGLNPSDDGRVVRVTVPSLTEERRKEIVKSLSTHAEDTRIALRNIRQDYLTQCKKDKQEGAITEDDLKRTEKAVDEEMQKLNKEIEELIKAKEQEIMKV